MIEKPSKVPLRRPNRYSLIIKHIQESKILEIYELDQKIKTPSH